jgi:hypothetical protein
MSLGNATLPSGLSMTRDGFTVLAECNPGLSARSPRSSQFAPSREI